MTPLKVQISQLEQDSEGSGFSSLPGSSFPRNPLTNQSRGFLEILFLRAGLSGGMAELLEMSDWGWALKRHSVHLVQLSPTWGPLGLALQPLRLFLANERDSL